MKNFLLFSFSMLLSVVSLNAQLYIGGVVDADLSGGVPKGFQICANADVPDLSIYGIGVANNGGGSDGQEYTFPAEMVSAGECFWIGNNDADFITFFGFAPCYTGGITAVNGDDPFELYANGVVIDVYGDVALDGTGTVWEYTDGWASSTDALANPTFDPAEWSISEDGLVDDATNAASATPYPSPAQTCPVVMPVNLTSFEVSDKNNKAEISWQTAQELNNSHFEIQHSTDNRTFTTIGKEEGAGNSDTRVDYEFSHTNPANGINYYRLQQFDFDGQYEYSQVVSVNFGKEAAVSVYPNPVQTELTIALNDEFTTGATAEVISQNGRTVLKETFTARSFTQTMNVNNLPAGVYVLRVVNGNEVNMVRFVKK